MKVFRKVFAAAIALTAIAMATSAFAADATYNAAAQTMSIADTSAFKDYEQATIAVVPTTFGGNDANEIYYINQGTGAEVATIAANIGLKGALNAPTNYEVRVGGEGDYLTYNVPKAQFVAGGKVEAVEGVENRVGVTGKFTVNAGITELVIKLVDDNADGLEGSYTWPELSAINSVNGATFTFGLEIVGDGNNLSGIRVTGVEVQ